MGGPGLEDLLRGLGLCREQVVEGGRWAVGPEHRRQGLGERFVVAGCEAVRRLGFLAVLCAAGTGDGQSNYLGRFGFEPVPGRDPVGVEELSDTVLFMIRTLAESGSPLGRHAGPDVAVADPTRS
jgi:predicted N-acetyltransferase YhbS